MPSHPSPPGSAPSAPTRSAGRTASPERLVLWLRFGQSVESPEAQALLPARLAAHRADLLVQLGSMVVCAFDPVDAAGAVEVFLELSEALRESVMLRAGLALGSVHSDGNQHVGEVLSRAEMLGQFADIGQLLVEVGVHDTLRTTYLFGKPKRIGAVTAFGLDLRHPRVAGCIENRRWLVPSSLGRLRAREFERLSAALTGEVDWLTLRTTQPYDALDLVTELAGTLRPAFTMYLRRHANRLQPLGSLVCGLASLDLERQPERVAHIGMRERDALQRLQDGRAVPRSEVRDALAALLNPPGGRAWVVCDQVSDLDTATVTLLAEDVFAHRGPLLVASLRPDDAVPNHGADPARVLEVSLAPPTRRERIALAHRCLGEPADDQLANHVVDLGGATALGVLEACRTLVASGDLVPKGGRLGFRTGPRAVRESVSVVGLLTEQLSGLSAAAHRLLEAACVAPPFSPPDFVDAVSRGDGLAATEVARARQELQVAGWLTEAGQLDHRHREVCEAVVCSMPSARSAELHRFAGSVWQDWHEVQTPGFSRALLAHYWWQGGRLEIASTCLMDAAEQAVASDLPRMGVRLAANAVHLTENDTIRERARTLVREVEGARRRQPTPTSPPPGRIPDQAPDQARTRHEATSPRHTVKAACAAIARADADVAERLLDTAVAAGWERAAARRLWAIAQLARGDLVGARRALHDAPRAAAAGDDTDADVAGAAPRNALAWALIHLESGDPVEAVRNALTALATCRRRPSDAAGQAAALATLAASFRALGDGKRADQLAERAEAQAQAQGLDR